MKITEIANPNISKEILNEAYTYKLWESAGKKIVEAQLTPDQIQQLFKNVETTITSGGGNRTFIGKGVDAASAVNKAWEDLKTKVQNSKPIQNVDAYYDQAAEKLKQATGGDQGVMQYVQKYRDFAKKHPLAQSLIYSALIAGAGISGAGLGGAAALGLFKMVDKLLQGEKFSSATYQGAKTGGMAYAAGQVGKALQGQPAPTNTSAADTASQATSAGGVVSKLPARYEQWAQTYYDPSKYQYVPKGGNLFVLDMNGNKVQMLASGAGGSPDLLRSGIVSGEDLLKAIKATAPVKESLHLNHKQVNELFEGILDTIKGAASKLGSKIGSKLTTKLSANDLMSAWQKAGSPTDSNQIMSILTQRGVPQNVVDTVYKQMKIRRPAKPRQQAPANPPSSFGQMAQQVDPGTPSSTGGTIRQTQTGQVHTARQQPAQQVAQQPTQQAPQPSQQATTSAAPAQSNIVDPKTNRPFLSTDNMSDWAKSRFGSGGAYDIDEKKVEKYFDTLYQRDPTTVNNILKKFIQKYRVF
jgi:hypothetical protein